MAIDSLQILIEAIDRASQPIQGVSDQLEKLRASSLLNREMGQGMIEFGHAIMDPVVGGLQSAIGSAMEMEGAMTALNKAYGFDAGSEQAMRAQDTINGLALEMGQMPTDVAAIATEAGKLGVQMGQLEGYTRLVTQASVAFDMSAQDAGESLGVLTNVLGYMNSEGQVNIEGLGQLGDTINYLADSGATSESAIVNVLKRAGGSTRSFGLASESAAGLAAAFLNLGDAPEVVGTALNGMLPKLMNSSRQTEKFQEGLKTLGIDAKSFEQAIRKDAAGAMLDFVDALGNADNASAVVSDMFGTGSDSAMLLKAAKNAEAFRKTMEGASNVEAGGMMATFDKQSSTTAAALERLKTTFFILSASIGSALLPPIQKVLAAITPLVQKFAEFAQANPKIVQVGLAFAVLVAGIGAALIVAGQLVVAFSAVQGVMATIGGMSLAASFGGVGAAIGAAIATVALFGAAIIGIAALVIQYWEPIKAFFAGMGDGILEGMSPMLTELAPAFGQIATFITSAIASIGNAINTFMGGDFSTDLFIQPFQNAGVAIGILIGNIVSGIMQLPATIGAAFSLIGAILSLFGAHIGLAFTAAFAQIGMILSGIGMAFIGAIAGIQAAWMGLGAFFSGLWAGISGAAIGAVAGIVGAITGRAAQAVAAVQAMGASMLGAIADIAGQMFAAGANIVNSIANGIRSAIRAVTSAISSVANAVRGALPFSPPEYGPLSDIMSVGGNIVNAIASGISPAPISSAMQAALSPAAGMMLGGTAGGIAGSPGAGTPIAPGASSAIAGAGSGTSVSVTVNVNGAGANAQEIGDSLEERLRELLPRLLEGEQRRRERVAYG